MSDFFNNYWKWRV